MSRTGFASGANVASLAAGPMFLASLVLAAWASFPSSVVVIDSVGDGSASGILGLTLSAIPIGYMLAILPNLAGAWLMYGLGQRNEAGKLPVMWALAGAAAAGIPLAILLPDTSAADIAICCAAFTGTSCALIARKFTCWNAIGPHGSLGA
jgi:hypothetical protein